MDVFFFWLFAAGMIGFSLVVVLGRNPVASALSFAASMIFMAALFVMLNAFFLAAVQILVTAGAVMVLFLFIIMLLDIGAMAHVPRQPVWMGATLVLALGFVYLLARVLAASPQGTMTADALPSAPATSENMTGHYSSTVPSRVELESTSFSNDDTHQIGRLLFTKYVAPFEVTSLLILVATVGVVVLCKDEKPMRPAAGAGRETSAEPRTGPALTR